MQLCVRSRVGDERLWASEGERRLVLIAVQSRFVLSPGLEMYRIARRVDAIDAVFLEIVILCPSKYVFLRLQPAVDVRLGPQLLQPRRQCPPLRRLRALRTAILLGTHTQRGPLFIYFSPVRGPTRGNAGR